jgi:putative transposase
MKQRLRRRYGLGQLHFITCSCYRRMPLLGTERARHLFLKILSEVRERYDFALIGYVVMPEHIHICRGYVSVKGILGVLTCELDTRSGERYG